MPQHSHTTSLTSRRGQVQRNQCPFPPVKLVVLISAMSFVAINLGFLYSFVWIPYASSSTSTSSSSSSTLLLQSSNNQVGGGNSRASRRQTPTTVAAGPQSSCEFREYPPHRYYHLNDKTKDDTDTDTARDFLTNNAIYIYGEWPILLPILDSNRHHQVKLCVHQEEWRSSSSSATTGSATLLPFADGTNPSLLSMSRFQKQASASGRHVDFLNQLAKQHGGAGSGGGSTKNSGGIHWLATVCMTNSQCTWKDTPADAARYNLNINQDKPDTVRTLILLLGANFETLGQATLHLQRDAPWGRRGQVKAMSLPEQEREQQQQQQDRKVFAFDDARLFLHRGQLWISYREGKLYGYDTQVLNPVHLEWNLDNNISNKSNHLLSFTATIRASESATLCCGRNMALLERQQPDMSSSSTSSSLSSLSPPPLQALTWVDPITVVEVDTTPFLQQQQRQQQQQLRHQHRRLQLQQHESDNGNRLEVQQPSFLLQDMNLIPREQTQPRRRRLAGAQKKEKKSSHIHGTNAFMVYWPQEDVFLGMGHYHRPNDREANEYARFGHHYTHTLFAIKKKKKSTTENSSPNDNNMNNDYYLHSLSPEFVIPSFHHQNNNDGEIIQFASGLEINDDEQTLVIGYGINDCEAAVVTMELSTVQALLRPVSPPASSGLQVVDLMQPLRELHV